MALPYFKGKGSPGKKAKKTSANPMPRRQRGTPDPQGDKDFTVGRDYGMDLTRQGTPRSYDETAKSSGRPKTDKALVRNRGGRSPQA